MTQPSIKTPAEKEVDGLLLAIDSLQRVASSLLEEDGTVLRQRTIGHGQTQLDLARKIHAEIGSLLYDVERNAQRI